MPCYSEPTVIAVCQFVVTVCLAIIAAVVTITLARLRVKELGVTGTGTNPPITPITSEALKQAADELKAHINTTTK